MEPHLLEVLGVYIYYTRIRDRSWVCFPYAPFLVLSDMSLPDSLAIHITVITRP